MALVVWGQRAVVCPRQARDLLILDRITYGRFCFQREGSF